MDINSGLAGFQSYLPTSYSPKQVPDPKLKVRFLLTAPGLLPQACISATQAVTWVLVVQLRVPEV